MGGLPRVGCVAEVRGMRELPEGRLQVEYVGTRRAKLVGVQQDEGAPFQVGAGRRARLVLLLVLRLLLGGAGG